jgi:uncharacterized membrane protein YecN with MAPEG domain
MISLGSAVTVQQVLILMRGAAMDCTRDFAQAGIIYADGPQRYLVRPSKRHPNGQSGIVTHIVVTEALHTVQKAAWVSHSPMLFRQRLLARKSPQRSPVGQ